MFPSARKILDRSPQKTKMNNEKPKTPKRERMGILPPKPLSVADIPGLEPQGLKELVDKTQTPFVNRTRELSLLSFENAKWVVELERAKSSGKNIASYRSLNF